MEFHSDSDIEFSADDLAIIEQRGNEEVRSSYLNNLRRILEASSATEVGRRFDFSGIIGSAKETMVAKFKSTLPVTDYYFWEPYIKRVMAGEAQVLSDKSAIAILTTGGTSGVSKYIPLFLTREMHEVNEGLFEDVRARKESNRTINLVLPYSRKHVSRTSDGLPITGFSSLHGRELSGIPSEIPDFINDVRDIYTLQFVKSLFFISNESIDTIRSTYVNILVSWFKFIRNNWSGLLDVLDRGDVMETDSLKLTADEKREISDLLSTSPSRLAMLRRIDPQQEDGLIGRIWPHLKETSSCHAGPYFRSYEQQARRFLGASPLRNKRMASNEMGIFGLGLSNKLFMMDTAMCNFFEFIEESQWDVENPETITDFENLELGRRYDIVVTTDHSGLYRYRQRDIIRIIGKAKNSLPIFALEGRIGASLSIGNCKILDVNFNEAYDHLAGNVMPNIFSHFVVKRDEENIPNRFIFYLECSRLDQAGSALASDAARVLDMFFCEGNYSYQLYRKQNSVGHAMVKLVGPGTVDAFADFKAAAQACSINQIKFVPILSNAAHSDYFDGRVIAVSQTD